MKIAVFGTGVVGQTIAAKLAALGHDVVMGTRNPEETESRNEPGRFGGPSFTEWHLQNPSVGIKTYEEAAAQSEMIINATNGMGSMNALHAAGEKNLSGKIILDISNPLDFSKGFPPSLFISNTDSLGEQIQREFPNTRVVKSLNTMNAYLMVNPGILKGDHTVFLSGNDAAAKDEVKKLLASFGWNEKNMFDLGDISTARGAEQILPIWVRIFGTLQSGTFNFHVVKEVRTE